MRRIFVSVFINVLLCLNAVHSRVLLEELGCPTQEDIQPCTCVSPPNNLECINVNNVDNLRTVFLNSQRYNYDQINISSSSLQYLPRAMFESTTVKNLILYNVTLLQLYDSQPQGLDNIHKLHIKNSTVSREMSWSLFEPLVNLRSLEIHFNYIRTLDSTFAQYVTKSLQQLLFYATGTTRIKPGSLTEFVNLDEIAFDSCQITELIRDTFPRPFYGRVLHFNENRITSISHDLFTDMPNLQILRMRNNLISVIPQSAFGESAARIKIAVFTGNPLKCDCNLEWIIGEKPQILRGSCVVPKRLHGRELSNLTTSDFNC